MKVLFKLVVVLVLYVLLTVGPFWLLWNWVGTTLFRTSEADGSAGSGPRDPVLIL